MTDFPQRFNAALEGWISDLQKYDFSTLLEKPDVDTWSLGQLYMHLLEETRFYLEQVEIWLSCFDNENEEMNEIGRRIFLQNDLPAERLKGDPEAHRNMAMPLNGQALLTDLRNLRDEINQAGNKIFNSGRQGKTRHPGFSYFNAMEWFQYAEMHFRHHRLQKQRIDEYLRKTGLEAPQGEMKKAVR